MATCGIHLATARNAAAVRIAIAGANDSHTYTHTHHFKGGCTMYINPFVAGILTTVLVELAILFVLALIKTGGKQ